MVRLRLRRVGRKKQPSYRIIAADKEAPRDGKFLEIVGFYNPRTEPETITLKEDRIFDWLSKGAQPSDSVARILKTAGAADRYERFKAGEDLEALMAEAAKAEEDRVGSPKTRQDGKKAKKAKAAPAEEAAPVAEAVKEEPAAEAAPVAEAVKEEPAAEEVVEAAEEETPAPEAEAETEAPAEETPAEEEAEAEAPAEEAPAEEEAEAEAPAEEEAEE